MSGSPADVVLVYVTTPDAALAEAIARTLVEGGQVACANILPGMRSVYRWKGAVETASECVLLLKTTADRAEAAVAAVRAHHPYEVPAILVLPVIGGHPAFLDWVRAG